MLVFVFQQSHKSVRAFWYQKIKKTHLLKKIYFHFQLSKQRSNGKGPFLQFNFRWHPETSHRVRTTMNHKNHVFNQSQRIYVFLQWPRRPNESRTFFQHDDDDEKDEHNRANHSTFTRSERTGLLCYSTPVPLN